MPQIALHSYQTPIYYYENPKTNDQTVKEHHFGSRLTHVSIKSSKNSLTHLHNSKNQKTFPHENHSKNKNSLLPGKSLSKKLFQGAKIISSAKRETFISHQPRNVEKPIPQKNEQKKIRFLRVPKPSNAKVSTPQKPQSAKVQTIKIFEKQVQPQISFSQIKEKKYESKTEKYQKDTDFKLDPEECPLIKKNNMFTSETGQMLLKNLIAQDSNGISGKQLNFQQNEGKKDPFKSFDLKIAKVISLEVNECLGSMDDISTAEKDQYKQNGFLSSFSKLIMVDRFGLIDSNELKSSDEFEEETTEDLSIDSKC